MVSFEGLRAGGSSRFRIHARARSKLGMYWAQFGAYHADRCAAVAAELDSHYDVVGMETASTSFTYGWERPSLDSKYKLLTIKQNDVAEAVSLRSELVGLLRLILREKINVMFFAGYERPAVFLAAICCRLVAIKPYLFLDSKFDDKPRTIFLEFFKSLLLLPYCGALVSGPSAASYLRFLGFRARPIALGYDTVSVERMRRLADGEANTLYDARTFLVVARLVPKKNIETILSAYAAYREGGGGNRKLVICGSGPLEAKLRDKVFALGIDRFVEFRGFCSQEQVASAMLTALVLLLPSTEEQWGLVVNEALAFGLPIIISSSAGAGEVLVKAFINGYRLDPRDVEQWSSAMLEMDKDEKRWVSFANGSRALAKQGDVSVFVGGMKTLLAKR